MAYPLPNNNARRLRLSGSHAGRLSRAAAMDEPTPTGKRPARQRARERQAIQQEAIASPARLREDNQPRLSKREQRRYSAQDSYRAQAYRTYSGIAERPQAQNNSYANFSAAPPKNSYALQGEAQMVQHERNDGLTGIRTLAFVSVLLYHLGLSWFGSGHMGVVLFLVLTGYLVTSTLARKKRETGSIEYLRFLWRRFLRIWPGMAVMCVFVLALCVLFNHVLLTKARPDLLPSLAFFSNISYILRNVSYFEALGAPSPFTHLWYLGLDAQFCLLWPVVLLVGLDGSGRTSRGLRNAVLVLSLLSAVLMLVLFNPKEDPSRVYYGFDTRLFSLLLGAWLGLSWPLGEEPYADGPSFLFYPTTGRVRSSLVGVLGVVALVIFVLIEIFVPGRSAFFYRGGMYLVSLLVLCMLGSLLIPTSVMSRLFSLAPLRFIGERSYSLYLWHYPLILLLGAHVNTAPWWLKLVSVLLSFAMGIASYELVEKPIAAGRVPNLFAALAGQSPTMSPLLARLLAAGALVVALIAGVGSATIADETIVPEDAIISTGAAVDQGMELPANTDSDAADETLLAEGTQDASNIPSGPLVLRASSQEKQEGLYDPVIIGDSVIGDTYEYVGRTMPDALLDSYVGRRPDQAAAVLNDYLSRGVVGSTVVLASFSNMPATNEELDSMVEACGDRNIYLVTVFIPQTEQGTINAQLAACASRHDNVTLIDWYSKVLRSDSSSWLYADGTHLTPDGKAPYVDMITSAIAKSFVEAGGYAFSLSEYEGSSASSDGADGRIQYEGKMVAENVLNSVCNNLVHVELTVDENGKLVEQTST